MLAAYPSAFRVASLLFFAYVLASHSAALWRKKGCVVLACVEIFWQFRGSLEFSYHQRAERNERLQGNLEWEETYETDALLEWSLEGRDKWEVECGCSFLYYASKAALVASKSFNYLFIRCQPSRHNMLPLSYTPAPPLTLLKCCPSAALLPLTTCSNSGHTKGQTPAPPIDPFARPAVATLMSVLPFSGHFASLRNPFSARRGI